jgi:hypothetical protein
MKRSLLNLVAGLGILGAVGAAYGGHPRPSGGSGGSYRSHGGFAPSQGYPGMRPSRPQPVNRSYAQPYGQRFSHGTYYRGRGHRHWRYWSWSRQYGCRCYWDPTTGCWYYWSAADGCYYPLSYAAVVPPEPAAIPPGASTSPVPFTDDALPPSPDGPG